MSVPQKINAPFHALTSAEAKQWYKDDLLTTAGYLNAIRRITCLPNKKWVISNVLEFCREWEIPKSAFYRAVDKLKQKNYYTWEATHGLIFLDGNKVVDIFSVDKNCPTSGTVSHERDTLSHERDTLSHERDTHHIYSSRARSDISDIADPPDSGGDKNENKEPEASTQNSASLNGKSKKSTRQVKITHEGKSSAAPCNDLSQVLDSLGIISKANALLAEMERLQIKPCQGYSVDRIAGVIRECDLSQLWGALRHIEETWETIHNPTAIFCIKAPAMPVEKEYRLPEFDRAAHEAMLAKVSSPEESKAAIEKIKRERILPIASASGDKKVRKFADLIKSMPVEQSKPNVSVDTDYAEQQRRLAQQMMLEDSGDGSS